MINEQLAEEMNETKDVSPEVNVVKVEVDTTIESALTTETSEVTFMSSGNEKPAIDTSLVKIKVSYPKDFEGEKYMKEGMIYQVSKESAQLFVDKKIAKIIK
jgi:hypothetical protein